MILIVQRITVIFRVSRHEDFLAFLCDSQEYTGFLGFRQDRQILTGAVVIGAVLLDITRTNAANRVTPVVTTPKNGGNQPSVERSDAFDKK